jgi:ketosteroid isomerase-like protein
MSRENVDLVLRGCDAWNRGALGETLELMTGEFEFRPVLVFFDLDSVYRGHDGWRRFWKVWREAWESVSIRVERVEDLGDRVLAMVTFDGVGRGSGAPVSMSFGQIWTLRDGLVERIDVLEPNDALEAAGLRETGSHAEPE